MQVVEFMDQQHIEINSYTCCSCLLSVTMTKKTSQLKATCRGNGYLAYISNHSPSQREIKAGTLSQHPGRMLITVLRLMLN